MQANKPYSLVTLTHCSVLKVQHGANLTSARQYAPLAQLVEHLTLNQGVQGSSP